MLLMSVFLEIAPVVLVSNEKSVNGTCALRLEQVAASDSEMSGERNEIKGSLLGSCRRFSPRWG